MKELKNPLAIIIFIFIALFLYTEFAGPIPFSINSVTTTKSDQFIVSAEGKATAIPDTASTNIGITVTQNTVASAQNQANQIINKISEDLKDLGVKEKDIKTINYSINPNYNFETGRQRIDGFTVSATLEVEVTPLEKINQVIDTATKDGANTISNVQFILNDNEKAKLESKARKEAVNSAKKKAKDLADASGVKLGRILNISETSFDGPRPIPFLEKSQAAIGGDQTSIEPGQSTISIQITLSYETL